MRVTGQLTTLDALEFSDFGQHKMLQSYLAEHDAVIEYNPEEYVCARLYCQATYTLVWKDWGYQLLCGADAGIAFAERMAFYIVWHTVRGRDWDGLLDEATTYAKKMRSITQCGYTYYREA